MGTTLYTGPIERLIHEAAPWYIQSDYVGTFLRAVGSALDSFVVKLKQGLALSQPYLCDASALPSLAFDRRLRMYATESELSQRERLAQWLQLHRQRGTHQGELRHLQPYYLPARPLIKIVHQDGAGDGAVWHTLDTSGTYSVSRVTPSNWDYDGQTAKWARFWVLLFSPPSWALQTYDSGCRYDDTGVYYDGLITAVGIDLVSMIREWQGAHSLLQSFILVDTPNVPIQSPLTLESPAGNWGSPLASDGTQPRPSYLYWLYDAGRGAEGSS
jgi:hypothetical protein